MKAHNPKISERIVVRINTLCAMLDIDKTTLRQRVRKGLLPGPVKIHGTDDAWRIREIEDWYAAGCPTPARPPTWVWRPAVVLTARAYESMLRSRIALLWEELSKARDLADDTNVFVRQGVQAEKGQIG